MSAGSDFRNVFGTSPSKIVRRLYKGAKIFCSMMQGTDQAAKEMPLRIQIEVTDKCNFNCIMCNRLTRENIHRALNSDINVAAFLKIIETVKPFYVTLNGLGEPLLNKDIPDIISSCQENHITSSMASNLSLGKVLNDSILNNPPNVIVFSLHAASKDAFESISQNSNYETCIAALRQFLSTIDRTKVTLNILCALQAKNLLEYKNMYHLLDELDLLANLELVPVYHYEGNKNKQSPIIPTDDERKLAIATIEKDIKSSSDMKEAQFYLRWKTVIGLIAPRHTEIPHKNNLPCLIPWYSSYIAANGNVIPCCNFADEKVVLGNVFETPFNQIWNNAEYLAFRKKLRENRELLPECNYCPRDYTHHLKKYGFIFRYSMRWKL